jgi:hypothetical protein
VSGTPQSVARLLVALEVAGCAPRQASPGVWLAACPTCLLRGWPALIEIRVSDAGSPVVACMAAHEPPQSELVA